MPMTLVIALNAALDLGIILGLFAVISLPFGIDRPRRATVTTRTAALPAPQPLFDVDLAA
jgi:hypothetical protein